MKTEAEKLGFKKGAIGECIVTTYNNLGKPNAAPIGVYFLNNATLIMKIYKNRTVENMLMNRECAVNVVDDAFVFLKCILDQRNFEYLKAKKVKAPILKDSKAVLECKVADYKSYLKKDKYGKSKVFIFKLKVLECYTVNNPLPKVLNRGENAVLEIAVKLSRRDYNIKEELEIAKRCLSYKDYKKLLKFLNLYGISFFRN